MIHRDFLFFFSFEKDPKGKCWKIGGNSVPSAHGFHDGPVTSVTDRTSSTAFLKYLGL